VVGAQQAQVRVALCALIALIVIVLALSASHSPGSGVSAEPSARIAADANTATSRRSGP
jgi:hypothetical protein